MFNHAATPQTPKRLNRGQLHHVMKQIPPATPQTPLNHPIRLQRSPIRPNIKRNVKRKGPPRAILAKLAPSFEEWFADCNEGRQIVMKGSLLAGFKSEAKGINKKKRKY